MASRDGYHCAIKAQSPDYIYVISNECQEYKSLSNTCAYHVGGFTTDPGLEACEGPGPGPGLWAWSLGLLGRPRLLPCVWATRLACP